jgi:hypothetical protein
MILWLVFGLWNGYVPGQPYPYRLAVGNFLLFILFVIVGWKVFGSPVQ